MEIHQAVYLQSAATLAKCPPADKPEFAFIGRSNVGKSSLINFLAGRTSLALTSKKPGKTKSINHFLINDHWYLVDLPGYGYASISKDQREKWMDMTKEYLRKRENLVNVFLLIDGSIAPQQKDIDFSNWLGEKGVPFTIVFTKTDKAKAPSIRHNIEAFNAALLESWEELPPELRTSVARKQGRKELLDYIAWCIAQYKKKA